MKPLSLLLFLSLLVPALSAQAPRGETQCSLGSAKLTLEYGRPPWSEQRLEQMQRYLPIGGLWRVGADRNAALVVDGAFLFGPHFIEDGAYGVNLRRTGPERWSMVLFESGAATAQPDDVQWEVAASLQNDSTSAADLLTLELLGSTGGSLLQLRWGPLHLSVPIHAVETRSTSLRLNEQECTAFWIRRPLAATSPGKSILVGKLEFEIDGEDCSSLLFLQRQDQQAGVLVRHAERHNIDTLAGRYQTERESLAQRLEELDADDFRRDRYLQQLAQLDSSLQDAEGLLDLYATVPDRLTFSAPLHARQTATAAGFLAADFVRSEDQLLLKVQWGPEESLIEIIENRFVLR